MPVASFCPHCRGKLAANTVRLAWCMEHHPVRDWMCWNAVMRLLLPVLCFSLIIIILAEAVIGGLDGIAVMLGGGLVVSLLGIMGLILSVMLLVFTLQGDDLLDCVMDAQGIHVQVYLPQPTPLKLLLRGKSPALADGSGEMVLISCQEIAWKDVQRVQLWPEKTMLLFYAPKWWMRVSLPCSPFTWEDALTFIRDKIGKKKAVVLPEECRQVTPARGKAAKPARTQQLSFDDVAGAYNPTEPAPEAVPQESTQEQEGDFTSLADVLEEIRDDSKA